MMKKVLVLSLCLVCAGVSQAALVGHWTFDTDGTATVGTNAVLLNGAAVVSSARFGSGSLSLDGVDDYAVPTGYKGVTGTAARSVSFWVNTGALPAASLQGPTMISWGGGTANGQRFDIKLENAAGAVGRLRVEVQGGYTRGTTVINDEKWHHVVVTLDAGKNIEDALMYIDGLSDARSAFSTRAVNTAATEDVRIGNSYHSGVRYYGGLIDDVRIYDHVLSDAEIQALFIPEPATMLLLGAGGLFAMKIRRKS